MTPSTVTLSWMEPTDTDSISNYRIIYADPLSDAVVRIDDIGGSPHTVDSLEPDTEYEVFNILNEPCSIFPLFLIQYQDFLLIFPEGCSILY